MRFIKQLIEKSTNLLMFIINLILYGIVFFIYEECKSAINVIDLNTDNVWTTFFYHPGESIGVFVSAIFLSVFIVWLILVAVLSIVFIVQNGYDISEIIISILNCILAVTSIILNALFVKVYWAILIVLLVGIGIAYLLCN